MGIHAKLKVKSRLGIWAGCSHWTVLWHSSAIYFVLTGYNIIVIIIIFSGTVAQRELGPPRPRGFLSTQNDAPQSVGILWTSDQLVAEKQVIYLKKKGLGGNCITLGPKFLSKCTRAHVRPPWYVSDRW
jgi:hypothetical protein